MATHVIEINPFDYLSIIRAEREFSEYVDEFIANVDKVLNEIAKIGRDAAQAAYGSAINVTIEEHADDSYSIVADGKAVVFLEFGAGTRVDTGNRYSGSMPFEVSSGSWSRSPEGSGEFAATGKWEFPRGSGIYMEYVQPRNGMEKAYEAMVRDILTVIRAVFG